MDFQGCCLGLFLKMNTSGCQFLFLQGLVYLDLEFYGKSLGFFLLHQNVRRVEIELGGLRGMVYSRFIHVRIVGQS